MLVRAYHNQQAISPASKARFRDLEDTLKKAIIIDKNGYFWHAGTPTPTARQNPSFAMNLADVLSLQDALVS